MNQVPPKKKAKTINEFTEDEISKLDKSDLIERIRQLEAHNLQLKNIISKHNTSEESVDRRKKPYDFSKANFRRVLLKILYFGWDYQGLAVQEDSNQTIEHHLFQALTKACLIQNRETSNYHRSGRTDKGVSAFSQVISISLRSTFNSEEQNIKETLAKEIPYCKVLNRLLPKEIRAVAWMPIPLDKPEFSARFDCKKRQYKYYFPRSNLNVEAMREACKHLVGVHDFRNLCKMDVGNGVTEFVRQVFNADIIPVDVAESPTQMLAFVITGNAFLWHQIRCICSILLLIGRNLQKPEDVAILLDVKACPRKPQYSMALDLPLNLFHCSYEMNENEWIYDANELNNLIKHLQEFWTLHNVKSTMIKDCLTVLEDKYKTLSTKDGGRNSPVCIAYHTDCLTQGVKPKVYKPLLERQFCSSLEERIEHYKKKRKLIETEDEDKTTEG